MGKGTVWSALLAGACLAALCMAPSPAAAAGKTYFASPTPAGSACTAGTPCSIGEAVTKAGDGDAISLEGGEYALPIGGLTLEDEVDFGAPQGEVAILETGDVADLHVTNKADAALHDLRIEGEGSLRLDSGSAERIFVAHTGVHANACELDKGTTLRNSVCWTQETNDEEEGVSHALEITSGGEKQDETVVLRNVTAIADNDAGNAIHVLAGAGAVLTVDAANVIARSSNRTDIVAEVFGGCCPEAHVNIVNSDFGEFKDSPSVATVTPLGTNGNISAAPTFANFGNGDFHVGGDSPTLDGGLADSSVGAVDLDGHVRSQAKCFGTGLPVPDMGAFERTPTDACPPQPPPPPPPVEPRKPVFRVVSLLLNKKLGNGRVLVEVPEGGGTLSLTGSGVKLVRRTASGEGGVISLPIQTWAITRVRLAKTGKTRVRLKVIFEGKRSGLEEWSKGVLLRKKIS
jgi:hypothetical protein